MLIPLRAELSWVGLLEVTLAEWIVMGGISVKMQRGSDQISPVL